MLCLVRGAVGVCPLCVACMQSVSVGEILRLLAIASAMLFDWTKVALSETRFQARFCERRIMLYIFFYELREMDVDNNSDRVKILQGKVHTHLADWLSDAETTCWELSGGSIRISVKYYGPAGQTSLPLLALLR